MAGFKSEKEHMYFPQKALEDGEFTAHLPSCTYILKLGPIAGQLCSKKSCYSMTLKRDIPACTYHRLVYETCHYRHNHPEELVDENS